MIAALAALLAAAAAPTASDLLAAPRPEAADYFRLKTDLGEAGFGKLQADVIAEVERRIAAGGCPTEAQSEVHSGLQLAGPSSSAEAFAADRSAARAGFARTPEIRRRLWTGQPVEAPYDQVAVFLKRAKTASNPRLAALHERVAQDQFVRSGVTAVATRSSWATGLSENAGRYIILHIAADMCRTDQDNTQWLKGYLREHGWPTISSAGAEADTAAWLLVQHADRDRPFQKETLALLEGLAAKNETSAKNYAYLYDRVAVGEKRPQRYGTQGRCAPGKVWEPLPLEDRAELDQMRAGVGLEPLAEYQKKFTCP